MKVIFLSHFGYNLPSARVRCYNFAEELQKYGAHTEVYSFYDKQNIDFTIPGDTKRIIGNIKAFNHLSKEKNAIIFVQKGDYHFLTPLMMKWLNKNKIIFDIDDWEYEVKSFHFMKSGWITNFMTRKSDVCTTASSFLKKEYEKYNINTHLLPTVVDHHKFIPKNGFVNNNNSILFSWVGMIWGMPILENVMFLMECFKEISDSNIRLEITGGGQFIPYVRRLAASRYKDASIEVKDWIHPSELPDYLNRIDVGLMPLITKTNYNLSKSPTKLFEYMACGKPTISSRIGEAKEWIIQDGINGFLADDKEEFKDKIIRLAGESKLRKKMGLEARRRIDEKCNQEKIGKQLFEIVNSLQGS